MEKINLERTAYPDDKIVFFAMPYGNKPISDGSMQNFEELYEDVYAPAMLDLDLVPHRADRIFGTSQGVLEAAWLGIQRAGTVVVDVVPDRTNPGHMKVQVRDVEMAELTRVSDTPAVAPLAGDQETVA